MSSTTENSQLAAATDTPGAAIPLLPMLTCVAAGLALAFTRVLIWRLKTGVWVCLQTRATLYYLQIAAQAYYNHLGYISDPTIADGVTFYPWLEFVPVVFIVRILGLSIFSVALIWWFCAAVGIGAGLYLVFWRFLRRPWMAAGLTILCLSDLGFCGPLAIVSQLRRLLSALVIHPDRNFRFAGSFFFFQWRVPNPALDLPFLFLQIVAVSIARERPRRLNLWLSGLAFGLLFYVYFFLWTMVAAALFIALFLDPAGRKVYRWTLLIGFAIGWPDLALSLHLRHLASAEGVARLGALVPTSRTFDIDLSSVSVSVAFVILVGIWIWKTRRVELIYLLSLLIAGILLGYSRLITGIFFHEYHYWLLWLPIRLILVLIAIASVAGPTIPRRSRAGLAFSAFAILYLIGAIYLNAIEVTRSDYSNQQLQDFVRFRTQRLVPGVAPLVARSVVAGSEDFCRLAGIAENQRQLGGWPVSISVALDDTGWQSRFALNAFLMGVERADFVRATSAGVGYFWFLKPIHPQLLEGFMRQFDEVTQNPDKSIRALEVRYVALPADLPPPAYVLSRFRLLQPGPYWQIWEFPP